MLRTESVSLHVPEPLALIDATLLFTVQVLIARHPELLLPPEAPVLDAPHGLHAVRYLLDTIHDLHRAITVYRDCFPTAHGDNLTPCDAVDDFPF